MEELDYTRPWYHGSQQELTTLRVDSSITQNIDVARAFSHRPSLVVTGDSGAIKHNGSDPGFLYIVAEEIGPEDIYPHPHPVNVGRWEWLTKRELRLRLLELTEVSEDERLDEEEIARLHRMQQEMGHESFALEREEET